LGIVPLQSLSNIEGAKEVIKKTFSDSYSAFKSAPEKFLEQIVEKRQVIPRSETMKIVEIIEEGLKS